MAQLEMVVELGDVHAGFLGIMTQAEKRGKAFFSALAPAARGDVRDHQREREGEDTQWPERAKSTQDRARRKSKRKRRKGPRAGLLGALPRSWKSSASDDGLIMTHRVEWSGIHDRGGIAGHGARIPRRQFSYLSPEFRSDSASAFADFVLQGYAR